MTKRASSIRPRLRKLVYGVPLVMESFRERRKKAGILLSYAGEARSMQAIKEALKVYKAWLEGKISYREALKIIKQIVGKG